MSDVAIRKVQTIENTLYANLPAEYAKALGLKSGDHVSIKCDEERGIIIIKKAEV